MTTKTSAIVPVSAGIIIGVILSTTIGLVYFAILREPGSAFYPFAALVFAADPVIGGSIAAVRMPEKRFRVFMISSAAIFTAGFVLFIIMYAVVPAFARTSVQLPAACDGFNKSYAPPADRVTFVPGAGDGILLASDGQASVVAIIDWMHPHYPSRVLLVNKLDQRIILSRSFENDVISAAIAEGTLILYNDKLGFLIDARTGAREKNFFTIDNYGGQSESDRPFIQGASDGRWYMETTAIISRWGLDGTMISRQHVTFNSTGRGCLIVGATEAVVDLSP